MRPNSKGSVGTPRLSSAEELGEAGEHPREVLKLLRRLRYSRLEPLIRRVL